MRRTPPGLPRYCLLAVRTLSLIVLNLAILVGLRHLALLTAFLGGMGAADHYIYEFYIYVPATVAQVLFLLYRSVVDPRKLARFTPRAYAGALLAVVAVAVLAQCHLLGSGLLVPSADYRPWGQKDIEALRTK